jgi:hypothetical protein
LIQADQADARALLQFVEIAQVDLHALLLEQVVIEVRDGLLQGRDVGVDPRTIRQGAQHEFALMSHFLVLNRGRLPRLPEEIIRDAQQEDQRKAADRDGAAADDGDEIGKGRANGTRESAGG